MQLLFSVILGHLKAHIYTHIHICVYIYLFLTVLFEGSQSVNYSVREDFESSQRLNLDSSFVSISTVNYTLPGAKTAF